MKNMKICPECGTENESIYSFCKNCGTTLSQEKTEIEAPQFSNKKEDFNIPQDAKNHYQTQQSDTYQNPQVQFSHPQFHSPDGFYIPEIQGVPTEEMALFVGKRASSIIPKFIRMELAQSKISWCWPAAILSFLLGPFGASLWFFYRKMYKIAFIFLAIATVMTAGITLLFPELFAMDYNNMFNSLLIESLEETSSYSSGTFILNVATISCTLISGLYGYHFYKKHAAKQILSYRQSLTDNTFYRMGIVAIGGVSGGMLTVGIIAIIFISNLISYFILGG